MATPRPARFLFGPPLLGTGSLAVGLAAAWQYSAHGAGFSGPVLTMLAALLVALGVAAYALLAQWRAVQAATEAEAARASAEMQLQAVLNILPEQSMCTIFDEQDRLVLANAGFRALFPRTAPHIVPGARYEDILRHAVAEGEVTDSRGREESWVQERLAQHRAPSTSLVQALADDRWMRVSERRTGVGWVVGLRVDVTDAVRKERDLEHARLLNKKQRAALEIARLASQEARALLESAIEGMPVGIEIFDPQDRLVLCNEHLVRMYPHLDLRKMVGQSFESILRLSLQHGWIIAALGREDAWLAERLAQRGNHAAPLLEEVAGGRWMHSYETRTPQGHIVAARMDVTEMVQQQQALEEANARLAELSATDGLTGIANRRRFDEVLGNEWLRCARHHEPLSLLIIDIDHFKRYNDRYGHLPGDEVLRRVAQILRGCIRRSGELVARYGGEEFVLLMPGSDAEHARLMAQRCMEQFEAAAIPHEASPTASRLTLSIGVASTVPEPAVNPVALVDAADAALYRAKKSGRNRFEMTDLFALGSASG